MKKKDNWILAFICFYTILLASTAGWTDTNLSVIGNFYDRKLAFLFWGIFTGFYFFNYTRKLFLLAGYHGRLSKILLFLSMLLLIFSVTTPYLPEELPLQSQLHILFAFVSPLLLTASLFLFLLFLTKSTRKLCRPLWYVLTIILCISVLLLFQLGFVSSLLEIFVVISTSIFLKLLTVTVQKKIMGDAKCS